MLFLSQGNKTEKKKRRRGKKGGEEGEGGEKGEEEGEGAASAGPTEIIKEIVSEDGTVMTIKEVIPAARQEEEEEEDEEDEEEEEDDGKMITVKVFCLYLFKNLIFSRLHPSPLQLLLTWWSPVPGPAPWPRCVRGSCSSTVGCLRWVIGSSP